MDTLSAAYQTDGYSPRVKMGNHGKEQRHLTPKEAIKSPLEIDNVELERRLDLLTPPTRQRTESLADNVALIKDTSCSISEHP